MLSPANSAGQIDRKLALYLSGGTAEVWVANGKHATMTVYRATRDQLVSEVGIAGKYQSPLLDRDVELADIFRL